MPPGADAVHAVGGERRPDRRAVVRTRGGRGQGEHGRRVVVRQDPDGALARRLGGHLGDRVPEVAGTVGESVGAARDGGHRVARLLRAAGGPGARLLVEAGGVQAVFAHGTRGRGLAVQGEGGAQAHVLAGGAREEFVRSRFPVEAFGALGAGGERGRPVRPAGRQAGPGRGRLRRRASSPAAPAGGTRGKAPDAVRSSTRSTPSAKSTRSAPNRSCRPSSGVERCIDVPLYRSSPHSSAGGPATAVRAVGSSGSRPSFLSGTAPCSAASRAGARGAPGPPAPRVAVRAEPAEPEADRELAAHRGGHPRRARGRASVRGPSAPVRNWRARSARAR